MRTGASANGYEPCWPSACTSTPPPEPPTPRQHVIHRPHQPDPAVSRASRTVDRQACMGSSPQDRCEGPYHCPRRVEDRAARFDQWIMIAFHCRKLGNLSTACTILRAFRRQALRRLRVTSAYLTRHQALEELQNLINPYDDYERVVALVAAPRKLTWCVPPLDAYIDCFSTGGSATVEQFLRKQTFSDSDGEDAAGPRYAIKRNEFLQAYMMNALDAASPVDEDWLDARTRELKAAEASLL
ncbi:hypothetical protein EXIGLDRAFT_340548 [Exidia glandulosa HHB12029]|uniref:Ras-GEF domain-containing protein n=1 Tax=Exidia glandulosa HHB12029 TaxID=1314781 RepID=A0A165CIL4_EXIGL|nr:hypothetical protein EXIGLDRAFT_340548 [Exidia glandulosa HHB12029]